MDRTALSQLSKDDLIALLSGRVIEAAHCRDARAFAAKPGHPARHDYEYERNGTANLFMIFAPLEGWRHVEVTDRRTAVDYAHILKELSDTRFPAAKIVLVQDNLNTHKPASLYEAFPAPEARRLVERFEWHYTPKHGSWLDLTESELSVLSGQCLDRRIPYKKTLVEEVAAWEKLLAAICERRVGAVLSIEASRLARNGRDWHTLLEFCGLVGTLIVDEDGIYDPRSINDRLLLGMKGTMSEMEVSVFRQRSMEAMKQKARRGELFLTVAVGYTKTGDDRIEMDPDRRVREARGIG